MNLKIQKDNILSEIDKAKNKDDILKINSNFKKIVKELSAKIKGCTDIQEKKNLGQQVNNFKNEIQNQINEKLKSFDSVLSSSMDYDPYVFKPSIKIGNMHPLIKLYKKMEKFFVNMGFSIIQGPEIELDKYNFEKLNMPYFHPARDMQDTFYVNAPKVLLRSHTSSVQIRSMETMELPLNVISPGTVYRVDDIDAQHTPMFYQVEGLTVGEGISFANLKFVLINLLKEVFGTQTSVRFRPTYYPYTEPSAAIDMSCPKCNKKGCALCGGAGWITVLGSGMVHPNVLENANVDTKKYSGFAFGLGLNRLAMIYFDMNGIREFYENDIFMWNQL